MKLFCRHSVCRECGVLFLPRKDQYTTLCLPHAQPSLDKDRRRRAVISWAETNWEMLEKQKNKEEAETRAPYHEANWGSQVLQQRMAEQMRPMRPLGQGYFGQTP